MAPLPELADPLPPAVQSEIAQMVLARAHAEGSTRLGNVYEVMFHAPSLAPLVGALGEHIRFHGVLPDDVRELVILRYSIKSGFGYEWSHHQRAADQAGISAEVIAELTSGTVPAGLRPEQRAAVMAVDAVAAKSSIPADVQHVLVAHFGAAGAVELVVACGLYAIMGYTVAAFEVPLDADLPKAPF